VIGGRSVGGALRECPGVSGGGNSFGRSRVFLEGSAFTSPFCCRFSWVGRVSRLASVLEGGGLGGVERGGGVTPFPSLRRFPLSSGSGWVIRPENHGIGLAPRYGPKSGRTPHLFGGSLTKSHLGYSRMALENRRKYYPRGNFLGGLAFPVGLRGKKTSLLGCMSETHIRPYS